MFRPFAFLTAFLAAPAFSQDRTPSHCHAFADATPGIKYLHKASFGKPLSEDTIRLSYISHSTYLLETEGGLTAATDFTGFLGDVDHVPTVVTMNHAHTTHFTHTPDPAIPHVLRGWNQGDGPANYDLELGEMLVRNVPTDIRSRFGDGVEIDGNSIFIFEVAGLCVGHLGHLHHEPTDEQYATIGRLDVVMAAVDGGMTVDIPSMIRILKRLRSSIVLPMHWHSGYSLDGFLTGMSDDFDVIRLDNNWFEISMDRLPSRPQIIVLQPQYLRDPSLYYDD